MQKHMILNEMREQMKIIDECVDQETDTLHIPTDSSNFTNSCKHRYMLRDWLIMWLSSTDQTDPLNTTTHSRTQGCVYTLIVAPLYVLTEKTGHCTDKKKRIILWLQNYVSNFS